jgi:hypothetical protein
MEELLRELLNEMERLDRRYFEFSGDTVVREKLWSAIDDGFVDPKPDIACRGSMASSHQ